jgi:hypothetical protein
VRAPDALVCDECRPHLVRAAWSFDGVDWEGRRLRLVVCEAHLPELDAVVLDRSATGPLVPLDGPLPARPGSTGWTR